jgi:hypothetical protein
MSSTKFVPFGWVPVFGVLAAVVSPMISPTVDFWLCVAIAVAVLVFGGGALLAYWVREITWFWLTED